MRENSNGKNNSKHHYHHIAGDDSRQRVRGRHIVFAAKSRRTGAHSKYVRSVRMGEK